ncbi:TonB-dependent receptor [Daejeonella oryzae]|uniref:TonB-dependent receptor n=1 Tax=Daejeonella oryzae TaxID=1122943 RepID=UPI0004223806|nr:TonB-dependent receptor plug domain-containing protein [Daejeonella oryzae]
MRFLTLFIFASISVFTAQAQHIFKTVVKDFSSGKPIIGASVTFPDLDKSAMTDKNGGVIFQDIPNGKHRIDFRYSGYQFKSDSISFPLSDSTFSVVLLKKEEGEGEELEEVVISSTRSSRTISTIATRIEVIAGEELDEKGNMKPGDIRMLLNESTGIQTQQTSATSANASIRIQGLDGRYTQILKDGFPLFAGAASGLGLLQTPPLDLKQVEVIKGSASTLYGGGAIAGLVNLISKTPAEERDLNFHFNGTSAKGLDMNGYFGQRFDKFGITLFASANSNGAYAPANLQLTAIPKFERYTLNPRLFLYFNDKTRLNFGINSSFENRIGGDIRYINNEDANPGSFFERNKTDRLSTQFSLSHQSSETGSITLKNSLTYFNREITIPGYSFEGRQNGTFTELTYALTRPNTEWIGGLNLWTDQFKENQKTTFSLRNYTQITPGAFIQNNIRATNWLELESGLRGDYVPDYGFALLPRISALFKISPKFTSRLGGGLGYKIPNIFTEESERIHYRGVLPVSQEINKLERSYGSNLDFNYQTPLFNNQLSFSINHLFFYTYLNHPIIMSDQNTGVYRFENLPGYIDTRGMETNVKFTYQDFKLFVGYSLTDTKIHNNGLSSQNPLTAKHRLNNVLMYEVEDKWKLGAEAYYYSSQKLTDGRTGKPYWILGFMAEKLWENFSLYINFENYTDTRQTRFETIYNGSISNPVFKDIYAPLDGFVVNGGIKFRL